MGDKERLDYDQTLLAQDCEFGRTKAVPNLMNSLLDKLPNAVESMLRADVNQNTAIGVVVCTVVYSTHLSI